MGGVLGRILGRVGQAARSSIPVEVQRWGGVANSFSTFPAAPAILVIKLDHIGDFVQALEAMAKIRAAWPQGAITLVCGSWNRALAEATQLFDRVLALDFYRPSHEVGRILGPSVEESVARFAALGLGAFDLAIDLRHEADTRAILRSAQSTYKAGFSAGDCEGLDLILPEVDHSARASRSFIPIQAAARVTMLADAVIAAFKGPERTLLDAARADLPVPFAPHERYIAISSAAGSDLKRWPVERWGELARRLVGEGYKVVFVGGENEQVELDGLLRQLPSGAAVNLAGRLPLPSLAPLLARAALFAGNDTGVTHLAAYLGVPTLAVYSGVSDRQVWMPRGKRVLMLAAWAGCSPCDRRERKECERGVPCIFEVGVERVFTCAQELLGAARN